MLPVIIIRHYYTRVSQTQAPFQILKKQLLLKSTRASKKGRM